MPEKMGLAIAACYAAIEKPVREIGRGGGSHKEGTGNLRCVEIAFADQKTSGVEGDKR